MNIDHILQTLHDHGVDYLLIGGVNFLLRHEPELTYDVDIWVTDCDSNLINLNRALQALKAEWGRTEKEWGPVPSSHQWLKTQSIFCLTSPFGALDIFREVKGLEGQYQECRSSVVSGKTAKGIPYAALSDMHMLQAQEALPSGEQKPRRIEVLRRAVGRKN